MPLLVAPSVRYRDSFLAAVDEFDDEDTPFSGARTRAAADFDGYLRYSASRSRGDELPKDWVPMSMFWLADGDEYIGSVGVMHRLTDHLRRFGGHIGYEIRPSQRGKGYGTLICRLGLDEARKLGFDRVLLTCGDTNVASVRIIERDGGVLEDKIAVEGRDVLTRRYWIEL